MYQVDVEATILSSGFGNRLPKAVATPRKCRQRIHKEELNQAKKELKKKRESVQAEDAEVGNDILVKALLNTKSRKRQTGKRTARQWPEPLIFAKLARIPLNLRQQFITAKHRSE